MKASPATRQHTARETVAPPKSATWTVRINADPAFVTSLPPRVFKMLFVLEGLWRDSAGAWPSNETLAARYGCADVRTVKEILKYMQDGEIIWRVLNREGATERDGVFARRRLDQDLPVSDEATIHDSIARLRQKRGKNLAHSRGEEILPPPGGGNPPAEKDKSLSYKDTVRSPKSPPKRQRSADALPKAEPERPSLAKRRDVRALPTAKGESPPAAPELAPRRISAAISTVTDGQARFLAELTLGMRAKFDALPECEQAKILGAHAICYTPAIAEEQKIPLRPKQPAAKVRFPDSTEEMLKGLPGSDRAYSMHMTERLVRDFGDKKDRQLWSQIEKHVCEPVRLGRVDVGAALRIYKYAMRPKTDNRGAYFWKTFRKEMALS